MRSRLTRRAMAHATDYRAARVRAHGTRLLACLFAAMLALGVAAGASLADTIATSAPASTTVNAGATTAIPGASVADSTNPGQTLLVTVSTSLGTLSMSQTSGLTLAYGYSAFSGSSISFTGSGADANAALASLALTGSGTPGTAAVSVTATANQSGIAYLPNNDHYYEYVASPGTSWTAAAAAANAATFDGQEGYLASVPSQTVKDFVDSHLNGAENVWAGGSSIDYPTGNGPDGSYRAWSWFGQSTAGQANYGGPLAGTVFTECGNVSTSCAFMNTASFFTGTWNTGEPNNGGYSGPGTGEHSLEINYSSNPGRWNDLSATGSVSGYVIEFGDQSTGASSWTGRSTSTANVFTATAPSAPTQVAVSTASGQATVSWTVPSSDGGSPITGYTVTATGSDGSTASCPTTTTSCTVTGLNAGVTYSFTVTAANAVGATQSAGASATLPAAPTPTPTPTPTPVPPVVQPPACPAPSGIMSATKLGPIALGTTQQAIRQSLTHYHVTQNGFDDFCLAGGPGIRVGYPTAKLMTGLSRAQRSHDRGRIVLALTANRFYAADGVNPRSTLAQAKARLKLGRGITIGRNTWYVAAGSRGSWVLKTQGHTVLEVGIASSSLTGTRAHQRALLTSF
jgi:hypothetical protein